HVANGDMVTLTLIQGVLNTFVIFLSRVIGYAVDSALKRDDRGGPGIGYYVTSFVMQIVLGFAASIVVAWFSRRREFAADAGGAHYAGKRKMIAALQKLKAQHEPSTLPQGMQAFGIASEVKSLFMTHPPLEERIARLQASA
ncbi:M48 family metalloprotease, partial [uncultured Nevskia sp.]|uniref:M48 family metalloprotease n=1 Tax=uncultured Nevskia sp. TaxID=228950 RepID=UPI0025EC42E7